MADPVTVLLQSGPLGELLDHLGSLIYLVAFLGAALLHAIKQARERKKRVEHEQQAQDEARARVEPRVAEARQPPGTDLEERVRRYFQEVTGKEAQRRKQSPAERPARHAPELRPPRTPAPEVAPPAPVTAPALREPMTMEPVRVDIGRVAAALEVRRPRRLGRPERLGLEVAFRRRPPPGVRRLLADRRGLKSAIVLREVLGPPLALAPRDGER